MTYEKSHPPSIQALFNAIARRYDKANTLLSLGLHKYWNRTLVRQINNHPHTLLDLCAGTGEISWTYLKQWKAPKHLILLDFSSQMLSLAKERAKKEKVMSISFLEADATNIPLASQSVDAVTLAYGLRNIKKPLECIVEVARVLRPGGIFGILELTKPTHPLLAPLHRLYLKSALPLVGFSLTSNRQAYTYLSKSISAFMRTSMVASLLKEGGFEDVKTIPLTGGIATLFVARHSALHLRPEPVWKQEDPKQHFCIPSPQLSSRAQAND